MLHYNFPPYSTGEVRPLRGTSASRDRSRRAGRAGDSSRSSRPTAKSFPYTIRIVSEILESNGSSSMATVCGSSLALMDAGVPIKAACAGVAMGLIKEGDRRSPSSPTSWAPKTTLGDMDFKVAGTEQGITSIQMDIKIMPGSRSSIMAKTALEKAHKPAASTSWAR